jgi:hypothetical protein
VSGLTEAELEAIRQRAKGAPPGPWYLRQLDDDYAASLIAVSTSADTELNERWPNFEGAGTVAATLVQSPNRFVDIADGNWDANAAFIAAARTDVPVLVEEVRRLRLQMQGNTTTQHIEVAWPMMRPRKPLRWPYLVGTQIVS